MEPNTICPTCGNIIPADAPLGQCPSCLLREGLGTATSTGSPLGDRRVEPPSVEALRPHFPQLEILELIGAGGMGAVYKARQPALDRLVALKILRPDAGEADFAERFTREARLLARLHHPGIVGVYDFGVANAMHYLVMEYVDGPNLRQLQQDHKLSPAEALQIVPQVCEALQFAHNQGIVHRDIKPENLLLARDGRVKIADFGIAKIVGVTAAQMWQSRARDIVGTPLYMAPEQIEQPAAVDHRADLYSLGVVFYEMLTGELPIGRFAAPSMRAQVDVRLDEVVLRTLEKQPERRYQRASHLQTDVVAISTTPEAGKTAAGPAKRINPTPATLIYGVQALLLVVAEQMLFVGPGLQWMRWLGLSVLGLIVAYVAWARLHHACWTALPVRYRAISPESAVAYLFIPGFNFYWAFRSFGKLASGFNAVHVDRPDLPFQDASALAIIKAMTFVAFWTIAWLPGAASIVAIVDLAAFALFYRQIAHNANVLGAQRAKVS